MNCSVNSVSMRNNGKWIVTAFLLLAELYQESVARDDYRPKIKLSDILEEDYDSFQTPKEDSKPAEVSIKIEILNIRSVNVREMSFIADIFLYKMWHDARLKFPAKGSLDRVALNPEWMTRLWRPDVYFHNAIEGKVQGTIIPYVFLWLKNDSSLIFGARLSLQFSCDMILTDFPHDTQTCDIVIKSFTHTLNDMDLHWNGTEGISLGDLIVLPQFELANPVTANCTEAHQMGRHGKFACLRGVIKLTRRTGYFIINIYIPTVLIVFMSMLTFWIPVDAVPGRVTLGVTSLLTIITKQYQASLPSVSYVVALNVWLSCCIGFVFGSLLEYAAVIALRTHQKRMHETLANSTDKVDGGKSLKSQSFWILLSRKVMNRIEKLNCKNIDRLSRVIFPSAFALQCTVYWTYYAK